MQHEFRKNQFNPFFWLCWLQNSYNKICIGILSESDFLAHSFKIEYNFSFFVKIVIFVLAQSHFLYNLHKFFWSILDKSFLASAQPWIWNDCAYIRIQRWKMVILCIFHQFSCIFHKFQHNHFQHWLLSFHLLCTFHAQHNQHSVPMSFILFFFCVCVFFEVIQSFRCFRTL